MNDAWRAVRARFYRGAMRRILIISVLALATLVLGGCTQASSGSMPAPAVPAAPQSGSAASGSAGTSAAATSTRSVVTTGTVTLVADDPEDAATEATGIVERAGGRVDGEQQHAARGTDHGSARLTLRIPTDALTATLDRLKKLGAVDDISLASKDVTGDVKDLGARIAALQTSVARLTDLMSRATSTDDLITIESALSQRQSDLESLQAQQRTLGDQVDLATITLVLDAPGTASAPAPDGFVGGLTVGWNAFTAFLSGALVVLGVLLPWIGLLAVLAAIVLLIVRLAARVRRAKTP